MEFLKVKRIYHFFRRHFASPLRSSAEGQVRVRVEPTVLPLGGGRRGRRSSERQEGSAGPPEKAQGPRPRSSRETCALGRGACGGAWRTPKATLGAVEASVAFAALPSGSAALAALSPAPTSPWRTRRRWWEPGSGSAGRAPSPPLRGPFLRPRRPRTLGGGPRDRCHPGEAPAGPRVAPGPGVCHLQSSAAGGAQPSRCRPHSMFTCGATPASSAGSLGPAHVVLHAPRVAQACGGFPGASFARRATRGAKNLTGVRFGFCLQRVYSLVGWLSM